ncbi:MAG: hypothetical protein KJO07_25860 [Deltaproteobacteria bacterium]|nr:hypothetical protein [Deltaproteobacteria bacterium]
MRPVVAENKIFTRDRLYLAAIIAMALLALGIFIAKMVDGNRHADDLEAVGNKHEAELAELSKKHVGQQSELEQRYLGILATALGGLPEPLATTPAEAYYPTLDALVRTDDVSLALVITAEGQVLACSNRHFEGKPAPAAIAKDMQAAGDSPIGRTASGWLVVATVGKGKVVLQIDAGAPKTTKPSPAAKNGR